MRATGQTNVFPTFLSNIHSKVMRCFCDKIHCNSFHITCQACVFMYFQHREVAFFASVHAQMLLANRHVMNFAFN